MIANILVSAVGALVFLFLFWKRLKDDYFPSLVFSTGFYLIFGMTLGYLVAFKFFPGWWFWSSIAAASIGFSLGVFRFKLKFYETFEAAVISLLPWLTLFFLADSVANSSFFSLALSFFILALIVLSYFLFRTYKNFSWYKSGRIGFTGVSIAALFFLIRSLLALFFPFMLSFVGKTEVFISAVASFTLFLLLFNLSRT